MRVLSRKNEVDQSSVSQLLSTNSWLPACLLRVRSYSTISSKVNFKHFFKCLNPQIQFWGETGLLVRTCYYSGKLSMTNSPLSAFLSDYSNTNKPFHKKCRWGEIKNESRHVLATALAVKTLASLSSFTVVIGFLKTRLHFLCLMLTQTPKFK